MSLEHVKQTTLEHPTDEESVCPCAPREPLSTTFLFLPQNWKGNLLLLEQSSNHFISASASFMKQSNQGSFFLGEKMLSSVDKWEYNNSIAKIVLSTNFSHRDVIRFRFSRFS